MKKRKRKRMSFAKPFTFHANAKKTHLTWFNLIQKSRIVRVAIWDPGTKVNI